jgi:hypothetical protein
MSVLKNAKISFSVIGGIISICAGFIAITQYIEHRSRIDISGEWKMVNVIESTSYSKYKGLKIRYRIFIDQDGLDFTAEGEKCWENDEELPTAAHTPISILGTIQNNCIKGTVIEEGTRRRTSGFVNWTISENHLFMEGTFSTTAANTSGRSQMIKIGNK